MHGRADSPPPAGGDDDQGDPEAGDEELYASGYSSDALDRWAEKVRAWDGAGLDVFVYFDNDAKVHAPFDAIALQERLGISPPSP